jgi:hypothetical protein
VYTSGTWSTHQDHDRQLVVLTTYTSMYPSRKTAGTHFSDNKICMWFTYDHCRPIRHNVVLIAVMEKCGCEGKRNWFRFLGGINFVFFVLFNFVFFVLFFYQIMFKGSVGLMTKWHVPWPIRILPGRCSTSFSPEKRKEIKVSGKVGSTLTKTPTLRVNLNLDGVSITLRTHTHPSHSETSRRHSYIGLVFIYPFIDS